MANILDYLDWRGDLTLAQDPFNEVDNLILAELSFVDFGGIVPGPGEGRAVPLWKAAEAYFAKTEGRPIDMGVLVPNQIPELLRRTAASPRFRDMKLNGFVDHLDTVKAEQFAALAAECGDGTVYLSFRGTDDTLAGWKEDFYLSCMREVPAQKMAVAYTEAMAHQYPRIKLRLGGHSKGGNLAVWAGVFCPTAVQRRIAAVWSNDGPGFHEDILSQPRHIRLAERIHTIVPKSSVVGMLLEHEEDYRCQMNFVEDGTPAGGAEAPRITVPVSHYKTGGFTYDPDSRLYRVEEYGEPYVDGDSGEQVAVTNVIVLKTACRYTGDSLGHITVDLSSGGTGYFACGGKVIDLTWSKDFPDGQLQYYDLSGSPISFGVGRTYVVIVPLDCAVSFE